MKCEEIAELLPDYLHEGLAAEQKSVVERHLESCVECRDVAGLWKRLTRRAGEMKERRDV